MIWQPRVLNQNLFLELVDAYILSLPILQNDGAILRDYVDGLTLKSLSTTRWKSHVESVKAIKSQVSEIRETLRKLAEISDDVKLSRNANILANKELPVSFLF